MGCLICKNPENVYYQPKEDSIVTILRRHENLIRKLDDTRLQLEEAKETISNLQREPCRNPTTIRAFYLLREIIISPPILLHI